MCQGFIQNVYQEGANTVIVKLRGGRGEDIIVSLGIYTKFVGGEEIFGTTATTV